MAQRKKFLLRVRPELWEEIARWAAAEFRSVNGQIEYLLQRAVDQRTGKTKLPIEKDERATESNGPGELPR